MHTGRGGRFLRNVNGQRYQSRGGTIDLHFFGLLRVRMFELFFIFDRQVNMTALFKAIQHSLLSIMTKFRSQIRKSPLLFTHPLNQIYICLAITQILIY